MERSLKCYKVRRDLFRDNRRGVEAVNREKVRESESKITENAISGRVEKSYKLTSSGARSAFTQFRPLLGEPRRRVNSEQPPRSCNRRSVYLYSAF